jgi:hypothetical protein
LPNSSKMHPMKMLMKMYNKLAKFLYVADPVLIR